MRPIAHEATEPDWMRDEARGVLAAAIPFDVWIGLAPRTVGDVDFYHLVMDRLHWIAEHGDAAGFRPSTAPADATISGPVWKDEAGMFYLTDDGALDIDRHTRSE